MGFVNYLDALKLLEKLVSERKLSKFHYTQRGGDITFHGPCQAILYPIISLREIGLGAWNYVEKLESTMIELPSLYGVKACVGQKDKEVTSLSRETSTVLPSEEVIHEQLISSFAGLFDYNTVVWKEYPSILSDHEEKE
ncbi:hypothetical protein F3Y22_tig00111542pilonHSYRG00138 [Hibiscus syriacus]|uniref:BPL/LPL catalytic domain-containing protein n=1 Tax=Hibiscus syriacus TaxID=106335 RepID=A0A6A2Y6X8_HIBSY|nr:hypothetical protein F3Y22_tig00111542pilonHSYRG00138 [Hibiscus syriacus]